MPELDDIELLRNTRGQFRGAFAALVTRHVNLVYSPRCAMPAIRTRRRNHAGVFIILAGKARICRHEPFSPAGCIKPRG